MRMIYLVKIIVKDNFIQFLEIEFPMIKDHLLNGYMELLLLVKKVIKLLV